MLVIDLQFNANMCHFVLHEPNQSFAHCMSNTYKAFASGPINEGGFGGRGGEGNFTA